jgi:hypothetical protein
MGRRSRFAREKEGYVTKQHPLPLESGCSPQRSVRIAYSRPRVGRLAKCNSQELL